MKLELVKKFEPTDIGYIHTATSLNEQTCVVLAHNQEDIYQLLVVTRDELEKIDLGYTDKNYRIENNPVLFSMNDHFGIIKDSEELLLYINKSKTPEIIKIRNQGILPQRVRLSYPSPVSDSNILPVCFESDGHIGIPRYVAFLKLDIENRKAEWASWTSLETKSFTHHKDPAYPPKLDSVMMKNGELNVFTSGGQTTSLSKWGMDYYTFVKSNIKGVVTETLLDSGDLHAIDEKKRGVNGLFSSSEKYLMLTPVFQSDEWKGKQKILSLESNELADINFPRGFGKYPQVIQHYGDYFWIFLRDTKEIAICEEK